MPLIIAAMGTARIGVDEDVLVNQYARTKSHGSLELRRAMVSVELKCRDAADGISAGSSPGVDGVAAAVEASGAERIDNSEERKSPARSATRVWFGEGTM